MRVFVVAFHVLGIGFFADAYGNFYTAGHSVYAELGFAAVCFGLAGILWLVESWRDR